jgi:hypothetical protein
MEQGIYYQMHRKQKWTQKKCVYKDCFSYFYVINDWEGRVYVFCQDINGDIILCILEESEWRYETLVHLDVIMPRYIRAFFSFEDLHLLYQIVDNQTNLDVLVYQNSKHGFQWSSQRMISIIDSYNKFPYSIYSTKSRTVVLMYMSSVLSKEYQLNYTTYHSLNDKWGRKEVLYTSEFPFIDYSTCAEQNYKHFLFITQDNQIRKIIYKQIRNEISHVNVLFQHKAISSCLLMKRNQEIFALWTCENVLYGSYSSNHGLDFSNIIVYEQFSEKLPIKVFYQKTETRKEKKSMPYELYLVNYNGEERLLQPDFLHNYQIVNEKESFSESM